MTSKPILCELYDYIEIACMFRFPVLLTLENGNETKGVAVETFINDDKLECLVLLDEQTEEKLEIVLNELVKMRALVENPHFSSVDFR